LPLKNNYAFGKSSQQGNLGKDYTKKKEVGQVLFSKQNYLLD
jgi:hypothetical protein